MCFQALTVLLRMQRGNMCFSRKLWRNLCTLRWTQWHVSHLQTFQKLHMVVFYDLFQYLMGLGWQSLVVLQVEFCADSTVPLTLPCKGSLVIMFSETLQSTRLWHPKSQKKLESRVIRYAVDDGNYRHPVILFFMDSEESWINFKWSVITLNAGFFLNRYQ